MNRYSIWKYLTIVCALLIGGLYTLPNFFGESPAVQISSAKSGQKLPADIQTQVETILKSASIVPTASTFEPGNFKIRLNSNDEQLKAKDALQLALNPNSGNQSFVIALNLVSRSPGWLSLFHASPMYLGLDLRGGVHFMLQVDMQAALTKKAESIAGDLRSQLREKSLRHSGINRVDQSIDILFRDTTTLIAAKALIQDQWPDINTTEKAQGSELVLTLNLNPDAARKVQQQALKQNITTLHNRINELGVAEPVIQQQGLDRIVVQLPGVQDTAKAKDILGRTATLEIRLVDDSSEARSAELPRHLNNS